MDNCHLIIKYLFNFITNGDKQALLRREHFDSSLNYLSGMPIVSELWYELEVLSK